LTIETPTVGDKCLVYNNSAKYNTIHKAM